MYKINLKFLDYSKRNCIHQLHKLSNEQKLFDRMIHFIVSNFFIAWFIYIKCGEHLIEFKYGDNKTIATKLLPRVSFVPFLQQEHFSWFSRFYEFLQVKIQKIILNYHNVTGYMFNALLYLSENIQLKTQTNHRRLFHHKRLNQAKVSTLNLAMSLMHVSQ